jgi:hypothetical protein
MWPLAVLLGNEPLGSIGTWEGEQTGCLRLSWEELQLLLVMAAVKLRLPPGEVDVHVSREWLRTEVTGDSVRLE